jgi:hypothetical protein
VRAKQLIVIIPKTKKTIVHFFFSEILETLYKRKLIITLTDPHTIFIRGEDKPLKGGLANGVGKLSPEIP